MLSLGLLPQLLGALSSPPLDVDGSDSTRAAQRIAQAFPGSGAEQALVVFRSDTLTADDTDFRTAVAVGVEALRDQPGTGEVRLDPPLTAHGTDPRVTMAVIGETGDSAHRDRHIATQQQAVRTATADASDGRVTATLVSFSSIFTAIRETDLADLRLAELIALPVVALVLWVGLGTLRAAATTMLVAGAAVAVTLGILALHSTLAGVNTLVLTTAVTLGWGLGLDYAILIVLRYRRERHDGHDPREAAARSVATAGTTAVASSAAIALCGVCLFTVRTPVFAECAFAMFVVAAVTAAAAVTLLPALLATLAWAEGRPTREGAGWDRWAHHLCRHPWPYAIAVTAGLLLLAAPATTLRLGLDLDRPSLTHTETGRGLVAMEQHGVPTVISAVLPRPAGTPAPDLVPVLDDLDVDPRIAAIAAVDNHRDTTWITLAPTTTVDSPEGRALVHDLRATLPEGALVGGATAQVADLEQEVRRKLWWLIALVTVLTSLYLVIVFRSVVLPLKALAMTLLAVAAAFGATTLVHDQVNFYVPVITFVVLFALSTDYEVFLVRRIREHHHRRHGDTTEAIAVGLRHTARPITLAAAVMVVVFAGLLAARRIEIRQISFALTVAVALDATVIRLVLVPTLIRLLGRYNWWLPTRLLSTGARRTRHRRAPTDVQVETAKSQSAPR